MEATSGAWRFLLAGAATVCLGLAPACGPGSSSTGGNTGATGTSGRAARNPSDMVKTVGGERLFAPPADLKPGEFVCETKAGRYDVDAVSPISRLDGEMVKADQCTNLDIPLYTPNHGAGTAGGKGAEGDSGTTSARVYLKSGADTYLRLKGE